MGGRLVDTHMRTPRRVIGVAGVGRKRADRVHPARRDNRDRRRKLGFSLGRDVEIEQGKEEFID